MSATHPADAAPAGLVTKALSNFADVLYQGELYRCQMRGRLRISGSTVLTGDRVTLEITGPQRGLITGVLPRQTELIRPPIANVELCVVVLTTQSPPANLELVDRILLLAQAAKLNILLCVNKIDLAGEGDVDQVRQAYEPAGWPLVTTSAILKVNLQRLTAGIAGQVAVMSGQSGVGKSTLLNELAPGLDLEVGDLSEKVQRGRHTTRAVELLRVGSGWIADAPGFIRLDLPDIAPRDLDAYYPEMHACLGQCRFDDCLHDQEPDCAVKQAVEQGTVDKGRYERYIVFLRELQARPRY